MPHVRKSIFEGLLESVEKMSSIELYDPKKHGSIFDLDINSDSDDVVFRYRRNGHIVYHQKSREFLTKLEKEILNTDSHIDKLIADHSETFKKIQEDINSMFHQRTPPDTAPSKKKNIMDPNHEPSEKSKLLTQLKESVSNRRRFKKGAYLMLRTKLLDRTGRLEKIYVVRQVVWSIDDVVIKGLVVKQVAGINLNMSSLTRNDCLTLHVKYEPGLQLLSMELPWLPVSLNKLKTLSNVKK